MPLYTWKKSLDTENSTVWLDPNKEVAITAEYEKEEEVYNLFLNHLDHFPHRNKRKLAETGDMKEAYSVVEDILGSEELDDMLDELHDQFPTQFAY